MNGLSRCQVSTSKCEELLWLSVKNHPRNPERCINAAKCQPPTSKPTPDKYKDWDSPKSATAVRTHLEELKWLPVKNYPWNPEICINAAKIRNFSLLQYAVENGCPWDPKQCAIVAIGGLHKRDQFQKPARTDNCPFQCEFCMNKASEKGVVPMLKWIKQYVD